MKVMTTHHWYDPDIKSILWECREDVRELRLENEPEIEGCIDSLLITKNDVIALAKEFNLIVFEEGAKL